MSLDSTLHKISYTNPSYLKIKRMIEEKGSISKRNILKNLKWDLNLVGFHGLLFDVDFVQNILMNQITLWLDIRNEIYYFQRKVLLKWKRLF
jgi:hypothetical protein